MKKVEKVEVLTEVEAVSDIREHIDYICDNIINVGDMLINGVYSLTDIAKKIRLLGYHIRSCQNSIYGYRLKSKREEIVKGDEIDKTLGRISISYGGDVPRHYFKLIYPLLGKLFTATEQFNDKEIHEQVKATSDKFMELYKDYKDFKLLFDKADEFVILGTDIYIGEVSGGVKKVISPRTFKAFMDEFNSKPDETIPLHILNYNREFLLEEEEVGKIFNLSLSDDFEVLLAVKLTDEEKLLEYLFTDTRRISFGEEHHAIKFNLRCDFSDNNITRKEGEVPRIGKIDSFDISKEFSNRVAKMQVFIEEAMKRKLSVTETDTINRALKEAFKILNPKFYS